MSYFNHNIGINPYPINLSYDTANRVGEKALQWCNYNHTPKKMKLTNTGRTVEHTYKNFFLCNGKVMLSGKWYQERPHIKDGPFSDKYVFSQIHFHWGPTDFNGSEHRVQGRKLPMEMHIVHFNTKYETLEEAKGKLDGLAVTVFFLQDTKYGYHLLEMGSRDLFFKDLGISKRCEELWFYTKLNFSTKCISGCTIGWFSAKYSKISQQNTIMDQYADLNGSSPCLHVAVLFEKTGSSNTWQVEEKPNHSLTPIITSLSEVNQVLKSVHIEPFPLTDLKFKLFETGYFLYCGSVGRVGKPHLILWLVYPDPITISHVQIAKFRSLESSTGDLMRSNVHHLKNVTNPEGVFFVNQIVSGTLKRESSLLGFPHLKETSMGFTLAAVKEQMKDCDKNFIKVNVEMREISPSVSNVDPKNQDDLEQGSSLISHNDFQELDQAGSFGDQIPSIKEYIKPSQIETINDPLEPTASDKRRRESSFLCLASPRDNSIDFTPDKHKRESSFLCLTSPRDNSVDFTLAAVKEQIDEIGQNIFKVDVEMGTMSPPITNAGVNKQEYPSERSPLVLNTDFQQLDQAGSFGNQITSTTVLSMSKQAETIEGSPEQFIEDSNCSDSLPFKGIRFTPTSINYLTQDYSLNMLSKSFAIKPVSSCTSSNLSLGDAKGSTTVRFPSRFTALDKKEQTPFPDELRMYGDESKLSIGEAKGSTALRIKHNALTANNPKILGDIQRRMTPKPKGSQPLVSLKKYASSRKINQPEFTQSDISLKESKGSTVKRLNSALVNKDNTKPSSLPLGESISNYKSDCSLKEARGSTLKRGL